MASTSPAEHRHALEPLITSKDEIYVAGSGPVQPVVGDAGQRIQRPLRQDSGGCAVRYGRTDGHSNCRHSREPQRGRPRNLEEVEQNGIYRLNPDGTVTLVAGGQTRPNGIATSPDEKTLYVANSDTDRVWWSYLVNDDQTLGEGSIFFDASS